ncbi:MAG: TolC family outer membrane protein [Magnetococcus sp. YQC-3]
MGARWAWSVSLSEAVSAALASSPTVQASEKQRLIAEQQSRQALAGYFPSVEFSTSVGNEQTNSPSTRSAKGGTVSLPHREVHTAVNQMIFDGFNVSNGVKKARALQKAAGWTHQSTVQTVAMDAVEQFLEVQKQRELLDKIQTFTNVQAEYLQKVRDWYTGGAGTVAEVWQTESRLALTRSSMATVESQLATAMDEFARLCGFGADALEAVPDISARLPHSLEQALALAAEHHPTLLETQANLEAADAARAASRAGFWPTLQLALSSDRSNNSGGFEGESQTNSAMLRMNYNLFRGGGDLAKNLEFNRRLEQAESQVEQAKQTVQKNVEKSWRVIQELRLRLGALQQHEAVSKQVAGAYYEQFIADQRSLLDVLNAENELFTAQSNRASGHFALLLEEYRLLANMGMLNIAAPPTPKTDADETRLTLQESWLTPTNPVTLYKSPQATGGVLKELPKQTPLRILQTRSDWVEVVDPEGNRGWVTGASAASRPMQSGMFVLPPATAPSLAPTEQRGLSDAP